MGGVVDGIRSGSEQPPRDRRARSFAGVRTFLLVLALLSACGIVGAAVALSADLDTVLGLRQVLQPGHYLVLFQNNAELRPSGGFIGSFATVDIGPYGIRNYQIDTNIYKRDKAFTDAYRIELPGPMAQGLPGVSWAMRDANWDLDFPAAARRTAWFYEQEGGESVDGVIAINASVVQDVLRLTGPLPVAELPTPLGADAFFEALAQEIEKDYFLDPETAPLNEPKSVLTSLLPVLRDAVFRPSILAQLPRLVRQELNENHIQLFRYDERAQAVAVQRGWAGEVSPGNGDYLFLNSAQIVGLKSSLKIWQEAELVVTTQADGRLAHQLTIRRTHTGDGVWPDHRNNNYLRIAIPPGSHFEAAKLNGESLAAVDRTQEFGATVFGTWLTTDPGFTSELMVSYTTPALADSYQLYYQKQSGVLGEGLTVTVDGQLLYDGVVVHDMLLQH